MMSREGPARRGEAEDPHRMTFRDAPSPPTVPLTAFESTLLVTGTP